MRGNLRPRTLLLLISIRTNMKLVSAERPNLGIKGLVTLFEAAKEKDLPCYHIGQM